MYIGSIIGYLSWPFMIFVSYWFVKIIMKQFEKKLPEEERTL